MARFILDVANLMPHQIEKLQDEIFNTNIVSKSIATMICIDETNDGQFEEDNSSKGNRITTQQIQSFKDNYPI